MKKLSSFSTSKYQKFFPSLRLAPFRLPALPWFALLDSSDQMLWWKIQPYVEMQLVMRCPRESERILLHVSNFSTWWEPRSLRSKRLVHLLFLTRQCCGCSIFTQSHNHLLIWGASDLVILFHSDCYAQTVMKRQIIKDYVVFQSPDSLLCSFASWSNASSSIIKGL